MNKEQKIFKKVIKHRQKRAGHMLALKQERAKRGKIAIHTPKVVSAKPTNHVDKSNKKGFFSRFNIWKKRT
jgi:hypothetical protein